MSRKYIIVSEGSSDVYSLRIICERIAIDKGKEIELDTHKSEPIRGPIGQTVVKIRLNPSAMTEDYLAICFSDTDASRFNDKNRTVKKWIEKARPDAIDRIACGTPERNLEAWLIGDEDCVKNLLNLPGDRPLPFNDETDPKRRLTRLVAEYGGDSMSLPRARKELAERMDFGTVARRNNSFKKFLEDFERILNAS